MEELDLIKKTTRAYSTIFPELVESYNNDNNEAIIDIISEKIIEKSKNMVDVGLIKKEIKKHINTT